jgi:hypothetical protein
MLKYSHPTLAWMLEHWPITVFLPAVLLLIAVLVLITRSWEKRDQEAREAARAAAPDAGVVGIWESGRRKPAPRPRPDQPPLGGGHDARAAAS